MYFVARNFCIFSVELIESCVLYIIVLLRSVECFNYAASVHGYILLYSLSDNTFDPAAAAALGRSLSLLRQLERLW